MRRVPSNFGDHGDQVYLVPDNFCNWLSFHGSQELLAELKGRRKERGREWVKHGWSNNGRWGTGRRRERKGIGVYSA